MNNLKYSVDNGTYIFPTEFGANLLLKNIHRRHDHIHADARLVTPEGAVLALSHGDLESGSWRREFASQAAARNSGDTVRFENVVIEAVLALENDPGIASAAQSVCKPMLISVGELIQSVPPASPPLVEGLFDTGTLQAVVAKPKVAKTLLVLGLAATVSQGGGIWLGRKVNGGQVALFQLEDSARTISTRIQKITSGRIPNQLLVHQPDIPFQINKDNYQFVIDACRGCSLVIIDPIIQASRVSDWNAASEVRTAYDLWRCLARELEAVVIVVAHHRKMVGDFGDQIAGSIQGLATPDGVIEIRRDSSLDKMQRKVSYVGRDWSDLEDEVIEMDPETLIFRVVGTASSLAEERQRNILEDRSSQLLGWLPGSPPGMSVTELCEHTSLSEKQLRGVLTSLTDSGEIEVTGKKRSRTNPQRFYRREK